MRKSVFYLLLTIVPVIAAGYFYQQSKQSKETPSLLENDKKGVVDLLDHWEKGNIVSLIRHTERCDQSSAPCLIGEKGITIFGKEAALKLGEDFKKLPDQKTIYYHSPVKRTAQTAHFMFGALSVEQNWLREDCRENLYRDIFKHKEEGKNLVLITHSRCMDPLGEKEGNDLVNMDIHDKKTYGISIFMVVDKGAKRINVRGYLYSSDWGKALR